MTEEPATFAREAELPRVPLPTLGDSCERFLEWCAPLLTPDDLAATERAVAADLQPESSLRLLHAALQEYEAADGVHSWLDAFWAQRYLGRRDRIALNANFFFLFAASPLGQVDRAAELLAAAVGYKRSLDQGRIPPVTQDGRAMSMEQLRYLFSATRVPDEVEDTVRTPYSAAWPGPSRERHVVVLHRGHVFRLDVIDQDGRPHGVAALADGLRALMTAGADGAPDTAVGHLTSTARAQWAANRRALLEHHPDNARLLDDVETALLCLCLDDLVPEDVHQACDQLLHGDSGNRWFDKALSFVVLADGTAGLNAEHAKLDGTTILSFVDALLGEPAPAPSGPGRAPDADVPAWRLLSPVLDTGLREQVRSAAASFAAYAQDTATSTLSFDLGTEQIKALRVSPDAFVQLAYQLAHQRARGLVGATYESIATRHFRHGRTEAMRVVTPEVLRFVRAMDEPDADRAAREQAVRAAADAHVSRARQCKAGQAPEQHLWELLMIQQRRGRDLGVLEPPSLFDSPGWSTMREDWLSTSSAPSTHIQHFGFGSTSDRCIGIAYVLLPDRFNVYLSTSLAVREQLDAFRRELPAAIQELRDLLAAQS